MQLRISRFLTRHPNLLTLWVRKQSHPIRFIGLLLTRMGLKQKRVGKSELGTYHVDNARIDLLNALVFRRRSGFMGVSIPLDTSTIAPKKTTAMDVLTTCMDGIKRFFSQKPDDLSGLCLA